MQLNGDTLHIWLNTKFNKRTLYLFNYNAYKHLNVSDICEQDIIKDQIYLR